MFTTELLIIEGNLDHPQIITTGIFKWNIWQTGSNLVTKIKIKK